MLASKVYLTSMQMSRILLAQHDLNCAYNGDKWITDPDFLFNFNAASDAELAEFLEEIKPKWKWYAPQVEINVDDATYELIDVLHFMAGAVTHLLEFHKIKRELIAESVGMIDYYMDPDLLLKPIDTEAHFYKQMSAAYRKFWSAAYWLRNDDVNLTLEALGGLLASLSEFIACGCVMLGIDNRLAEAAYMVKNNRNHQRVKGGVMKGVDVKKDEGALCLPNLN